MMSHCIWTRVSRVSSSAVIQVEVFCFSFHELSRFQATRGCFHGYIQTGVHVTMVTFTLKLFPWLHCVCNAQPEVVFNVTFRLKSFPRLQVVLNRCHGYIQPVISTATFRLDLFHINTWSGVVSMVTFTLTVYSWLHSAISRCYGYVHLKWFPRIHLLWICFHGYVQPEVLPKTDLSIGTGRAVVVVSFLILKLIIIIIL